MRTESIVFKFRDADNGYWISELAPTIATPGIYIIIDTNDVKGAIALMCDKPNCGCVIPLHCQNIPLDGHDSAGFPCSKATVVREAMEVFNFLDAKTLDELVYGMRNALGVEMDELNTFCRAAMECIAETEWDITPLRQNKSPN